eukprot:TRINITY_DN5725_c0_g1_i2.p1 TRINITY_DN5725_c0_g1~~TRINITY_DN5725_c0_g1_i2.p1  ORF type:complete len:393 (-),score=83.30 TRINITY_DN5725_c0_g1_i2:226-1404(-)
MAAALAMHNDMPAASGVVTERRNSLSDGADDIEPDPEAGSNDEDCDVYRQVSLPNVSIIDWNAQQCGGSTSSTSPASYRGGCGGPGRGRVEQEAEESALKGRSRQWARMLEQGLEDFRMMRPGDFQRRVSRGIPAEFRWQVWKEMLRVADRPCWPLDDPQRVQDLLASRSQWQELIELDAPRTFPDVPTFDAGYRRSLCRILSAYANLNPRTGYCQGMSLVVGMLLLVSDGQEVDVLKVLCNLMDRGLEGFYKERFPSLLRYQEAFDELLWEHHPDLCRHFQKESVQLSDFLSNWFLSLYVHCLPLPSVLIIWDRLMCDGLEGLLLVGVAVLGSIKHVLLSKCMSDILALLSSLRTCQSQREAAAAGSLLVRRSYQLSLPPEMESQLQGLPS